MKFVSSIAGLFVVLAGCRTPMNSSQMKGASVGDPIHVDGRECPEFRNEENHWLVECKPQSFANRTCKLSYLPEIINLHFINRNMATLSIIEPGKAVLDVNLFGVRPEERYFKGQKLLDAFCGANSIALNLDKEIEGNRCTRKEYSNAEGLSRIEYESVNSVHTWTEYKGKGYAEIGSYQYLPAGGKRLVYTHFSYTREEFENGSQCK